MGHQFDQPESSKLTRGDIVGISEVNCVRWKKLKWQKKAENVGRS
jgi:hypothetical protein